jgi:hypothetical protein
LGVTSRGAALAQHGIASVEETDAEFSAPAGKREPLLALLLRLAG